MEAWVLILALKSGFGHTVKTIDLQNEDACVIVAKELTKKVATAGICVNQFDGRVLYFTGGRQVDEFK